MAFQPVKSRSSSSSGWPVWRLIGWMPKIDEAVIRSLVPDE